MALLPCCCRERRPCLPVPRPSSRDAVACVGTRLGWSAQGAPKSNNLVLRAALFHLAWPLARRGGLCPVAILQSIGDVLKSPELLPGLLGDQFPPEFVRRLQREVTQCMLADCSYSPFSDIAKQATGEGWP